MKSKKQTELKKQVFSNVNEKSITLKPNINCSAKECGYCIPRPCTIYIKLLFVFNCYNLFLGPVQTSLLFLKMNYYRPISHFV